MVWKRRRLSRGRYVRRRTFRRRGTRRLSKFIKRVASRMSELKWATTAFSGSFNNQEGASLGFVRQLVPTIGQGPNLNQRIGNNIRYKNFKMRFQLSAAGNDDTTYRMFTRIIIFQPRMVFDDTSASLTYDLLFDPGFKGSNVQYLASTNGKNVRILYDSLTALADNQEYNLSGAKDYKIVKLNRKLNNKVTYKLAASTLPEDPKDIYYIYIIWPFNNVTVDYVWNLQYHVRISYRDA